MNLTEFKNEIAKKLGLGEESHQDAVWAKFCEDWDKLQAEKKSATEKLEHFKEQYKINEATDADFKKAALEAMKITGSNTVFVSPKLQTFVQESYCKENSKGFYYKAEKAGEDVTLTKIQ